ncbi:uncharacterized protein LOC111253681 isoform X2 [Varroa destructor]|uniref:Uncharacterized protein n=1 Tax=Varroa destructor TaxID=109461 RepID=A0A7M7KQA0_VARDE|nr:uncharacterized protein LOC111253681 isoform X2 [Varroa destructor]
MEQSPLGTTVLVDEIVSDALQRLRAGDILPDESLSFAPREPIARSTSVTHPAAHWGYRSYTDDILKSFIDRPSGFSGAPNFSNDSRLREEGGPDPLSASASLTAPFSVNGSRTDVSRNPLKENSDPFDNSICSNLFNEQQNRHQLDSSEEFVSGEKLLDEFEADQRRCQEENLFKDSRPVPFECASLAVSPEKVVRKQVQPPEWTEASYRVDSESFFTATGRESRNSILSGKQSSIASTTETLSANNSITGHQKGSSSPVPVYDCGLPYFLGVVLPGVVTHFNLPAPFCSEISVKSYLNGQPLALCHVSRNSDQRSLRVSVQPPPDTCGNISVILEFNSQLVIQLAALSMLPVLALPDQILLAPNIPTKVNLRSTIRFAQPLQLNVVSTMVTSKEVKLLPDDGNLSLEVTAKESDKVLDLQLMSDGNTVASLQKQVAVRFPQISLRGEQAQDVCILAVKNEERFPVEVRLSDDFGGLSYSKEVRVPERQTLQVTVRTETVRYGQPDPVVTFNAELLSPVQIPLPLTKCRVALVPTFVDLKPDLARFVWIAEKELVFTMSNSQRSVNRKPSPWKSVVRISPCNFISDYLQLRVSNDGRCAVFVMVVDGGHRNGEIIAPGASTQLTVREPCRIVYGLECWRILVRYRTAAHRAEIQAQIRHTNARPGLEPEYLMIEFRNESNESTVDKGAADKLPDDAQSLIRLYQLFMTTVEEIHVQGPEPEASTFFAA